MNHKENLWDDMDWFHLSQDSVQCRDRINMAIKQFIPLNTCIICLDKQRLAFKIISLPLP